MKIGKNLGQIFRFGHGQKISGADMIKIHNIGPFISKQGYQQEFVPLYTNTHVRAVPYR